MGLPITKLYLTNTGDESGRVLLSSWIPVKKSDGKYYSPPNTPIGLGMWVPNLIDLKEETGIVTVKLEESIEETGIWLMCFDNFFGNEQHIYASKKKPMWDKNRKNVIGSDLYNSLHVLIPSLKTKAGDGPINIGIRAISNKRGRLK